ncbi:CDP-diacylglycerol--glycerol-3-phosphate 3-phosphatidyltransferase [Subtercola boreus]|uniref:CDP-diacylglycerol--glycerol-3-phosphate 3-phosphatidyltransferase n=1 Tax=Subtercola boreus TaxID=120213 RepID=A0A3E0WBL8_9MICO|nr:CDP-diacylglycerol--glycerol-3-phosphate 3-phosphatidyltransferase [Subtercola boreus]RFA21824.1 CDP-diacylglycerol--glycerol-3-phosphate 3-phosphatidyltransferase [Subtercola boreus]RFA21935.1 CDP-diacylglycerol--glycerol-3-phosphate 3-phosphatidyltransferase [Subtercola boreus]RFA27883.1 CDP-diacylglycerol--glycerol-3-phosphate 3-phosphatidyltransferase [Subtercola boreus]
MSISPDAPAAAAPRSSNWNLPNGITIVRIILAPVFFWMLLADNGADGVVRYLAAILFILAIATDGVDGHLARKNNQVTDLGKILDPIADKVLTGAALVGLSILAELPWWVTIIILIREVGITVFRFAVLSRRVIPASRGGKLKTLAQSIAISLALLPLWVPFGDGMFVVNTIFMAIAFVLTVITGLDYLYQDYRLNRAAKTGSAGSASA